jgi:hypothetical protein
MSPDERRRLTGPFSLVIRAVPEKSATETGPLCVARSTEAFFGARMIRCAVHFDGRAGDAQTALAADETDLGERVRAFLIRRLAQGHLEILASLPITEIPPFSEARRRAVKPPRPES